MSVNNAVRLATGLACALMVLGGCTKPSGPAQPSQTTAGKSVVEQAETAEAWQRDLDRLKALGAAYHARIDSTGNAPGSWEEVKQAGGNAQSFSELESEGWVVAWGTHFRDAKQGTSQFVLAYSPSGMETESFVLFLDGSVSRIPPEELKAKLSDQGATAAAAP
jgi:hypothetical protein